MADTKTFAGVNWTLIEGLWISSLGAVRRESRHAWFAFPSDDDESSRGGPFSSLQLAAESLGAPETLIDEALLIDTLARNVAEYPDRIPALIERTGLLLARLQSPEPLPGSAPEYRINRPGPAKAETLATPHQEENR